MVAEGCRTLNPVTSTYAGVVSRESTRIAFTYAALNGLDVWAADVQSAFLQAPCSENYYTFCGPELGSEFIGKLDIIVRAAHGLKSVGSGFRNHLRDCMEHLGYESCKADPDVWMRSATRADGETISCPDNYSQITNKITTKLWSTNCVVLFGTWGL